MKAQNLAEGLGPGANSTKGQTPMKLHESKMGARTLGQVDTKIPMHIAVK